MEIDPESGTPEADKRELLALILEDYEDYEEERRPIGLPDAVDAIRFRMDQQGLTQRAWGPTSAVAPVSPRCSRASGRSACA